MVRSTLGFLRWSFGRSLRVNGCVGGRSLGRRWFAGSGDGREVESFDVKCASSGRVRVDLYNSEALKNPTAPLLIYLPPTDVHLSQKSPSLPPLLASLSSISIARINYRWNIPYETPSLSLSSKDDYLTPPPSPQPLPSSASYDHHPFPTPLHDTLGAFDFLVNTLLPARVTKPAIPTSPYAAIISPAKSPSRPLIIYGDYLGGTLATSLALTESHSSKNLPFNIAGLITRDAVFDWTETAATIDPKLGLITTKGSDRDIEVDQELYTGKGAWNEQDLQDWKTRLFSKPQSCFDNFVSPYLFFCTPTSTVPACWVGTEAPEVEPNTYITSIISDPEALDGVLKPSNTSPQTNGTVTQKRQPEPETLRIAYLKFPPRHSIHTDRNLKLPRSLFICSPSPEPIVPPTKGKTSIGKGLQKEETNPLVQADEMMRLMQRSIVLHEFKDRVMWDGDVDPHAVADERIQVAVEHEEGSLDERIREWIEEGL